MQFLKWEKAVVQYYIETGGETLNATTKLSIMTNAMPASQAEVHKNALLHMEDGLSDEETYERLKKWFEKIYTIETQRQITSKDLSCGAIGRAKGKGNGKGKRRGRSKEKGKGG